MPIQVGETHWGSILQHRGAAVLELNWRGEAMSDGGFMATLCLLASEAERLRIPRILIDAMLFRHSFGEGVMEWRDATVIPRYGAAGVRRFAFVMPEEFPRNGTEATEGPAVFPTGWFASREAALAWLAEA